MINNRYFQLRDLSLSFEDFALKSVDLEIQKGEYFVLLGPTGAGKTVLLEAIAGIIPLQAGSISLAGKEISSWPPEQRGVGFVYQDYALFPHLTVEKNISFGLLNKKRGGADITYLARLLRAPFRMIKQYLPGPDILISIKDKVMEISLLLNINHLLDRDPGSLSGGEKQRVAMARALITDPQILLLDEPLSSLDPETREKVQFELRRIHKELGTTTLHITHNFEVAAALADRIGVIIDGEIVQIGTPREIFRQPNNESVARFVGVQNIFRGQHNLDRDGNGHLELDGFEFFSISELKGMVRASIRPEDILLSRKTLVSSARNNFKGYVINISERGSFSYITVRIPSQNQDGKNLDLIVLVTHSAALDLELELDLEIYVSFKATALHIF
jgi:molybdopterin-binding protein